MTIFSTPPTLTQTLALIALILTIINLVAGTPLLAVAVLLLAFALIL